MLARNGCCNPHLCKEGMARETTAVSLVIEPLSGGFPPAGITNKKRCTLLLFRKTLDKLSKPQHFFLYAENDCDLQYSVI